MKSLGEEQLTTLHSCLVWSTRGFAFCIFIPYWHDLLPPLYYKPIATTRTRDRIGRRKKISEMIKTGWQMGARAVFMVGTKRSDEERALHCWIHSRFISRAKPARSSFAYCSHILFSSCAYPIYLHYQMYVILQRYQIYNSFSNSNCNWILCNSFRSVFIAWNKKNNRWQNKKM